MSVIQWFRTKTGIDVGNFAELISQESDKIADQRRSEPKGLDLSRLPVLENELFQLQFRIQDCHECLQVMEPELTRVADQLRQKLEGLADLEKQIRMLRQSLLLLTMACLGTKEIGEELTRLGQKHGRDGLKIGGDDNMRMLQVFAGEVDRLLD